MDENPIKTPDPIVINPISEPPLETPKVKKSPIIKILLVVLILIIILTGTVTTLIAYEKVQLKSNPGLQTKIANVVMSIPFTPKTPRYILTKSTQEQSKLTSGSFDLSAAAETTLPYNLDFQFKGKSEFSDPKNPKAEVNISLTKDVNMDLITLDHKVYFRVNKVDGLVKAFISQSYNLDYGFLGKWYVIDTTHLDTQARKGLEERVDEENLSQKYSADSLKILTDEMIIKSIVKSDDNLDGTPVYKLDLKIPPEVVDKIPEILSNEQRQRVNQSFKLSDIFTNIVITTWIGKKDYYVRRVDTSFDIEPKTIAPSTNLLSGENPTKISVNLTSLFSEFNKQYTFVVPEGAQDYTELIKYLTPGSPL